VSEFRQGEAKGIDKKREGPPLRNTEKGGKGTKIRLWEGHHKQVVVV